MRRLSLSLLVLMAGSTMAAAASGGPVHAPSDFEGTWRISKWVGESQGGFSGPDPNRSLGKIVQITSAEFRSPERSCRLRGAAVTPVGNREIETSLWGGQLIKELRLSRLEIAKAFGRGTTDVFKDQDLCVSAVMVDHDHILDAFGSGVVYQLDRVN